MLLCIKKIVILRKYYNSEKILWLLQYFCLCKKISLEIVHMILNTFYITIKSNDAFYELRKFVILGKYYNIEKILWFLQYFLHCKIISLEIVSIILNTFNYALKIMRYLESITKVRKYCDNYNIFVPARVYH